MTKVTEKYTCTKCGHNEHDVGQLRASSGGLMAIFDLEDSAYTTVSCTRCGHTDLFKGNEGSFLEMLSDAVFS